MYLDNEIKKYGIEFCSYRVFMEIIKKIEKSKNSSKVALQFVLEEIEAANLGNEAAINFANNSGFTKIEYEGAMDNSFDEVDGPEGPQAILLGIILLISDVDLMVSLRIATVDRIMKIYKLGKYK